MSLFFRPGSRPAAAACLLAAAWSGRALALPAPVPGHQAATTVQLAPHTASYDLALASTTDGNTVAATGTMNFKVTDACQGWETQQQLHLQIVTRDGQSSDMVSTYATLESKDGRHLTFDMQERDNGSLSQEVRGEASLDAAGDGTARYTLPSPATMALPRGTLFPMAHTEAIIRAAQEGGRSIDPVLFDGTSADGPTDSYVTILGWHAAPSQSEHPSLAALGSGRVHVAFFNRKPTAITPDYEIGMRYFANGVSDQMAMDFGSFTLNGVLHGFTPGAVAVHCRP